MYYINETDIKLFEFAIIYFSKYGKENFKEDSYKLNWFSIFTIVVYNGGYYNNLIEYDELSKAFNSTARFFSVVVNIRRATSSLIFKSLYSSSIAGEEKI